MTRKVILMGLFLGVTSIILGAFGAHGLRKVISPESIISFEVGVRYQMYHALFLLFVGISKLTDKQKKIISTLIFIGVICFSGSIYALATNSITPFFDFTSIALVTPIGGTLLIFAWTITINLFFRHKK